MGDKKEQQDVQNALHFLFTAAAAAALSELHQSVYTSQTCCSPTNLSRSLAHIHSHASLYTWRGERAPSGEELHRRLECRPRLENCVSSGNVRATLSGSPSVSRRPSGCTRSFVFSLDDVFRLIRCDSVRVRCTSCRTCSRASTEGRAARNRWLPDQFGADGAGEFCR